MRKLTLWGIGLLFSCYCYAQNTIIQTMDNQTTHLVFPSDIIYTDIGDNQHYIIDYTNNILRVKGVKTQKRTNLTVLTKDQHFYSFFVMHFENPQLNYFITPKMAIKVLGNTGPVPQLVPTRRDFNRNNKSPPAALPTKQFDSTEAKANTRKVNLPIRKNPVGQDMPTNLNQDLYQKAVALLHKPHLYDYIGARHGDIQLKVTGIYHSLHNCFMVYEIRNKGAIPYDISYIEFGIKERKRPKKSALHEQQLSPLFTVKENITRVLPYQVNEYVAVFGKVTVPNDRLFYMEVVEDGRNITLDILFHKLPIKRLY